MKAQFEAKYQEIAEEMQQKPWMQVVPKASTLRKEWNVDRWIAGGFSTYAVERMNGKNSDEAMDYTKKMHRNADFDNPATMEETKPIADTPEARAHFEKLVRGR